VGRLTAAAAAVLTVAALTVAPALVRASPALDQGCALGYGYAGYASRGGVHGVAATLTALERPRVATGHAAAWVGVGGIRAGRAGRSEWLQAGIAAFPQARLRLYVEAVAPGARRKFTDLGPGLGGRRYRIRVAEVEPDVWQATVDGRAVGTPVYLPTAHGAWRGVVTSESWRAGRATCNRYAYRFESVSVRGSAWTPLRRAEQVGRSVAGSRAAFSATG
jgi:hypothetical protein